MKIALLGDIAFFGKFDILKNRSIKEYFAQVSDYLSGFDYVIGNLETPLISDSRPYGFKSAHIKAHPVNIELLLYLNIGIVNLANNHMLDYGREGYESTVKLLREKNIRYFGIDDKDTYLEDSNNKIVLHGYCCYSTNPVGIYKGRKSGINRLDVNEVKNNMRHFYKSGYSNIVSFHLGQEHVNYPNYDHMIMARQLAEVCPYVFYGHHPHVVQGIEEVDESLIAYSLGNFCFDDVYTPKSSRPLIRQSDNNKSSIILILNYIDNHLVNYEPVGIFAGEKKLIVNYNKSVENVMKYSEAFSLNASMYTSRRNEMLSKYLQSRKQTRDLNWYAKRLKPASAWMLLASHRNKYLYKKHVLKHLQSHI